MEYPSEFPRDARARVEAEKLRAYAALEQDALGTESWRRDTPFIRCIMRVFLAFAKEACEFGLKTGHPDWSDRELDQRCRDFLLSIAIDAWEEKAKDLGFAKVASSGGWGYSLVDDARRRIEKSPEWKQYQEMLLETFEAQSAHSTDCNFPQDDVGTASQIDAAVPAQTATTSKASSQIFAAERVSGRRTPKEFIDVCKRQMHRSYEKFAAHIGIGKDTLYAITNETRWVSNDNYIRVAEACGCQPEDLHPSDVRRPKHRR